MNRFHVTHRTSYRYTRAMSDGFSIGTLLPRDTPYQRVLSAELWVGPDTDEYEERLDRFGNRVVRFGVHRAHDALDVTCISDVEVGVADRPQSELTVAQAAAATAVSRGSQAVELDPFLGPSALVPDVAGIDELVDAVVHPDMGVVDAAAAWCAAIFHSFTFDTQVTDVSTPLHEVLAQRHGVCQDFAHVAIAGFRHVGLAARYVSGYLETEPPPGQPKLVGVDASHAWCAVFVPGHGWADLDPTNDQFPPLRHVTVAWGRDYSDVAPLRGVVIGPPGEQELTVSVDVASV
jgi:transglutaminase-like putative cysteine protease